MRLSLAVQAMLVSELALAVLLFAWRAVRGQPGWGVGHTLGAAAISTLGALLAGAVLATAGVLLGAGLLKGAQSSAAPVLMLMLAAPGVIAGLSFGAAGGLSLVERWTGLPPPPIGGTALGAAIGGGLTAGAVLLTIAILRRLGIKVDEDHTYFLAALAPLVFAGFAAASALFRAR